MKHPFFIFAATLALLLASCGPNNDPNNPNDSIEGTPEVHEYVDLGLPSGLLWATCNIGAATPDAYGDYFAWGETATKTNYTWSTYKYCRGTHDTLTKYCTDSIYGTVDNKTTLDLEDDAAHVNWGGDWRMPTYAEYEELIDNCTATWTTLGGHNGYRVTGPNGNSVFFPCAGFYYRTSISSAGKSGFGLSASLYEDLSYGAWTLDFMSSLFYQSINPRCFGRSVRPVRSPLQK